MTLVDHHCHLDFPDFADELDGVIARAKAAGVGLMVSISTRIRRFDRLLQIAERTPTCSARSARIRTTRTRSWMCRWRRSCG